MKPNTENPTERRKADREWMAQQIAELARECGAQAEVAPPIYEPKDLHVNITCARGLCLSVEFEAKSCQPDVYVLSWHFKERGEDKLSFLFGDVNRYHQRKSTEIAHGYHDLRHKLYASLCMVRDGTAFETPETVSTP